jgi:glycosyltransferase involved in cell wall biosynthesis
MNVCVVAEYYPRRRDPVLGVWAHLQAVAARDAGADVRVLALERPIPPLGALRSPARAARALRGFATQPRHEERDGIAIEYVRFLAPPRDRSYVHWDRHARRPLERALARLHRSWPIDVVHAHYALPAGGAARAWAAAHGKPLVISVHGGDVLGPLLQSEAARARVGEVLKDAAGVLCNSANTLARAEELTGGAMRGRVVRLGARAPEQPLPKHSQPTVATLGHVIARKRHEDVLRALSAAAERLPEVRWVVIGDGPERGRLEPLATEAGVRATWLGQLDHGDALRELARCHVMALPSVDEAFGVAYVEALACGVPAIGARGEGGPEEIAAAGGGMLLTPARDPAALAATLAELLSDPAALERLAAEARHTAREHFSWEACGRATVAAYREAMRVSDE